MFSPKQQRALDKAKPDQKAAMRKLFSEQRAAHAKPQNKPQNYAVSAGQQKRAHQAAPRRALPNLMDPTVPAPMPSSIADGKAVPITSLATLDFKLSSHDTLTNGANPGPSILLVTNTGNTPTVGMLVTTQIVSTGAIEEVSVQMLTVTSLLNKGSGAPTSARSMKFGVSIGNNTNGQKRGGMVTFINTTQRLPDVTKTGDKYYWDNVIDAVKSTPQRRRLNGDVFADTHQLIGTVVDNPTYHSFAQWRTVEARDDFLKHVLDEMPTSADLYFSHRRPMSTCVFVFEPTDDMQDYSISVRASYYTRWPMTTVQGENMPHVPTAPATDLNLIHKKAEANSQTLHKIATGAAAGGVAGATLGGSLGEVAQRVARWGRNAGGRAARGLEAFEAEAIAAAGGAEEIELGIGMAAML